jgi:Immunity protein 53
VANAIEQLQDWYASHCDGEWEHDYGVDIGTLDNPGWRVRIALSGTAVAERPLEPVHIVRSEGDWIEAWLEEGAWNGACGPLNLAETVALFLAWAGPTDSTPSV